MKKLLLIVIGVLSTVFAASAQDVVNHCVAFSVGAPRGCDNLSEAQLKTLELKCLQILTRNNAAKTAFYNAFVVYPILEITDERTVNAGTADITIIEAELTLVAQNAIDGSKYGSVVVKLEGSGSSTSKAYSSIFQNISPTAGIFTGFIKKSTDNIIKYYSDNMGKILNWGQTLIANEQYQDAADLLCSIPFCVPAFDSSIDAINGLIKMIADSNCRSAIEMANRYIANGYYSQARDVLNGIKTGSTCAGDVQTLLEKLKDKKDENTTPVQ